MAGTAGFGWSALSMARAVLALLGLSADGGWGWVSVCRWRRPPWTERWYPRPGEMLSRSKTRAQPSKMLPRNDVLPHKKPFPCSQDQE